jgi:hypothetical protein
MDDFFKLQKKIKRDFVSFKSAEEMEEAINKVRQSESEKEKLFDAVKIFDNPEVLVIATNTHEASCRYGAGTKWCTAAKDTDENWKRHNQTGTEFIWIIKNLKQDNPSYKFSLHLKWGKNKIDPEREVDYDWCNAQNNCGRQTPEMLIKYFGKNTFDEIFKKCVSYHTKRNEERVKRLGNYSDLHQKMIQRFNQNFDEIEKECETSYYAALDDISNYWYDDLDHQLDTKEIKLIFSEMNEYMSNQENEIIDSIKEDVESYIFYMDPIELSEEFLNSGITDQNEFITKTIDSIDIFEIAREITYPILDQFFREKGF